MRPSKPSSPTNRSRIATLAVAITRPADISGPQRRQVVLDSTTTRCDFSRALFPGSRPGTRQSTRRHLKHLGLYSFRRAALLIFRRCRWETSNASSSSTASLDGNGYKIRVAETAHDPSAWIFPRMSLASSNCFAINVSVTTASFLSCVVNEKR